MKPDAKLVKELKSIGWIRAEDCCPLIGNRSSSGKIPDLLARSGVRTVVLNYTDADSADKAATVLYYKGDLCRVPPPKRSVKRIGKNVPLMQNKEFMLDATAGLDESLAAVQEVDRSLIRAHQEAVDREIAGRLDRVTIGERPKITILHTCPNTEAALSDATMPPRVMIPVPAQEREVFSPEQRAAIGGIVKSVTDKFTAKLEDIFKCIEALAKTKAGG